MKVKVTAIDHHCGHDVVYATVGGRTVSIDVPYGYQCKNSLQDKLAVFQREAEYYRDGLQVICLLLEQLEVSE
ncbi:hypothetical protein [Lawsonella clevelandensis]|uniref:hypothetical protein n=1 Tax=Lawsonella clevelandensis TaxID=1528099 RepID=UPI0032D9A8C3